jgi:malate permease and related proteins
VAPVFIVVGSGAALRALGKLKPEADGSLLSVAVNFLYPCFIADVVIKSNALQNPSNVLIAPAVGSATLIIGFAVAFAVAMLMGMNRPQPARTFAFTSAIPNWGYLAIPVVQSLFPGKSQDTLGVLFIHNIGLELTLWSVGVWLLAGEKSWRRAFNIPFFAILGSLLLSMARASEWLPVFVKESLHFLGQAALPLSLLLTGATFADQFREKNAPAKWSATLAGVFVKIILLPPLFILAARWLPCSVELKRVMVVQAAMPTAMVPVVLARIYGGDSGLSLRIIFATTALGLVTIPLWLRIGFEWIGK